MSGSGKKTLLRRSGYDLSESMYLLNKQIHALYILKKEDYLKHWLISDSWCYLTTALK